MVAESQCLCGVTRASETSGHGRTVRWAMKRAAQRPLLSSRPCGSRPTQTPLTPTASPLQGTASPSASPTGALCISHGFHDYFPWFSLRLSIRQEESFTRGHHWMTPSDIQANSFIPTIFKPISRPTAVTPKRTSTLDGTSLLCSSTLVWEPTAGKV